MVSVAARDTPILHRQRSVVFPLNVCNLCKSISIRMSKEA